MTYFSVRVLGPISAFSMCLVGNRQRERHFGGEGDGDNVSYIRSKFQRPNLKDEIWCGILRSSVAAVAELPHNRA